MKEQESMIMNQITLNIMMNLFGEIASMILQRHTDNLWICRRRWTSWKWWLLGADRAGCRKKYH